jgi:hypothetical protein
VGEWASSPGWLDRQPQSGSELSGGIASGDAGARSYGACFLLIRFCDEPDYELFLALQEVTFALVKARFFRFTGLLEINANSWTSAAQISFLPAGFDGWRRDLNFQPNAPLLDPTGEGIPLLKDSF